MVRGREHRNWENGSDGTLVPLVTEPLTVFYFSMSLFCIRNRRIYFVLRKKTEFGHLQSHFD